MCEFYDLKITQKVAFDFSILAISTNFSIIKIDLSGTTVRLQPPAFQKLVKLMTIFGIINELLSTQYVIIARFARNVE